MVVTPLRVFIFLVAAFFAAGGTAYYTGALDRYFAPDGSRVADAPPQQGAPATAGSDKPGETAAGKTDKPAAPAGETQDGEPQSRTASAGAGQTSDRVAKAGSAEDDGAEAGSTKAGEGSDGHVVAPAFDVVRVEPDGSMVVAGRAEPKSSVEVVSGSTIVGKTKSGPEGDFVVVLDKPLKPGNHQIVLRATAPDSVVATSKETAVVSVPDSKNGEVLALVEEPGKPSRLITKPKAKEPGEGGEKVASAAAGQSGAGASSGPADKPAGEPSKPGEDASGKSVEASGQNSVAAGSGDTGSGATVAASGSASPQADAAAHSGPAAAGSDAGSQPLGRMASAEAGARAASTQPSASNGKEAAAKVFIEAVEIDGKDIFVAGGGVPGQRVRVYANDILLGEATVAPNGRFLVQATRDLKVGDYIVRADLLSSDGAEVVARAAVPFEREPGEKLAAVAPANKTGDASASSAGTAASPSSDAGQTTAPAGASSNGAAAPGAGTAAEDNGNSAGAATASGGNADGGAVAANAAAGNAATGEGGMKLPDLHNGLAENAPVFQEPKLQASEGAVIIRRGDTLWHISQRVYGHGTRYSTIYLANEDQIRDPDMIWPGQVFSVPDKTEKGETADMTAIGEQSVSPAMAGTQPDWLKKR